MSVKDTRTVDEYTRNVAAMQAAIEKLQEFVESLPAPDENGHLPSPMDYSHTGSAAFICDMIEQAAKFTDGFWK
jgi:hypothetical protein